jgi:antitoxin component HigA of HigAB toxin-antitoxin module
MDIKVRPVRSEEDYEAVLAEIDELMDAEPGTSEGDRLDVLVPSSRHTKRATGRSTFPTPSRRYAYEWRTRISARLISSP